MKKKPKLYYKKQMNNEQILMCVVALVLGMLLANMLKSVCGCKNLIEGQSCISQNPGRISHFACGEMSDGRCVGADVSLSDGRVKLTNMNCNDACALMTDETGCNNINPDGTILNTDISSCNCEWSGAQSKIY